MNKNFFLVSYYNYEKIESMTNWIKTKTHIKPLVAVVCGSGLGQIASLVEDQQIIPYDEIPDFPRSTGIDQYRNYLTLLE
jgi:purine-nucleoside phosphorylase